MAVSNEIKGPIVMNAQGDSISSPTYITWLRWVGATTAGHSLVVNDGDGDRIASSECDGANFLDIIPIFRMRKGVVATTMQSGELSIYFK
ncbi:MAG: hypothetical protein ACXABY_14245 [Candidatus Thorarchaeota archaeon]|jgi:hypothetical protein